MRGVFACVAALVAGSACGSSEPFDACRASDVVVLSPGYADQPVAMDVDERGYVVFWVGWPADASPDATGVFVARPGEAPVRLVTELQAERVRAVPVAGGHLACWTPSLADNDECVVVDADLHQVVPVFTVGYGRVVSLGRIGTQLFALTSTVPTEGLTWLVPLDESGTDLAPPVQVDCAAFPPGQVAWSDQGLACLVVTDPTCMFQSSICQRDLVVHAPDGSVVMKSPEAAPYGPTSDPFEPQLAVTQGGYLLAWSNGPAFTRTIAADGTPGTPLDVGVARRQLRLLPQGDGFVEVWVESPDSASSYRLLRAQRLDATGAPSGDPFWLADPEGDVRVHDTAALVSASTSGVALAWTADAGTPANPQRFVLFRSLGCDLVP